METNISVKKSLTHACIVMSQVQREPFKVVCVCTIAIVLR